MKNTKYLAFDIETVPMNWDSFSESQQEYILRRAETEEEIEKKKDEMGLTPLTAKVVCIGMQLMTKEEGQSEYSIKSKATLSLDESLADNEEIKETLATGDPCFLYNEKTLLEKFWGLLHKYNPVHLLSFNGRNFDAPFLMLRSALLGVKPSQNLMSGTKYNYGQHTDLIDELTFFSPSFGYGATKKFNFDFYTRAFGLTSPKSAGINGSQVPIFFAEGKIKGISEYCLRDVTATWELFLIWQKYLKF